MTWGDEAIVRQRFEAAGIAARNIRFERATWYFRQPGPPTDLFAIFRQFYGPMMKAFEAAASNGRSGQLAEELAALFAAQNRQSDATEIPATFLKVMVSKG